MTDPLEQGFLRRHAFQDLITLLAYGIVGFIFYRGTLRNWFISDDPAFILSSTASIGKILLSKDLSYAFYLPMGALSFKADALLFGLNPLPYHVHNTLLLVLVCFMVYKILRIYTSWPAALLPPFIVLLSPPSLVCLLWLTVRTYLYGMFFALLAVYLNLKHRPVPGKRWGLVLLSMILCELSFMSTERYMALPFVLFSLSEGGLKKRIADTAPYFMMLALHFLLRWYVMGGLGGYLGASYDPVLYARTTVTSLFTASRVLFGFSWVILVLLIPLLLRPTRWATAVLVWLTALSVQFVVMFFYPSLDTYRYWFMPAVLFSFLIGVCSTFMKNIALRTLYLAVTLALFAVNVYPINRDLKEVFGKESLVSKTVSELLVDRKYQDAMVLYPDNTYIVASGYIGMMVTAYEKIEDLKTFNPFFPFELLAFYPEVARDARDVYEVRGDEVTRIADSLSDRIKEFRHSLTPVSPGLRLSKRDDAVWLQILCESGRGIDVYLVKNVHGRGVASKTVAPYVEEINITPFVSTPSKQASPDILPLPLLSYESRQWDIGEVPLKAGASVFVMSCVDVKGRRTGLSDMIYVSSPGESSVNREGSR